MNPLSCCVALGLQVQQPDDSDCDSVFFFGRLSAVVVDYKIFWFTSSLKVTNERTDEQKARIFRYPFFLVSVIIVLSHHHPIVPVRWTVLLFLIR